MKRILTLAFSMMMVIAVMAADKATAYFTVTPGMTCQNCENKIKTNLRYEKGVKEIATSLSDQLVTVTYDPAKTSPETLAAAFKKIGYTATATTPVPKAGCNKAQGCKKAESGCCKKAEGGCKKAQGGCCKKAEGAEKKCDKAQKQCGSTCKK